MSSKLIEEAVGFGRQRVLALENAMHMLNTSHSDEDTRFMLAKSLVKYRKVKLLATMACTKTQNTETKPSERNRRNHRNTGTKPAKQPKQP